MMKKTSKTLTISTSRFGDVKYEESMIFLSPKGIPGFENMRRWLLVGEDDSTIKHLQNLEDGGLALPVAVPQQLFPDYSVKIPREFLDDVKAEDERDLGVLLILTVPSGAIWDMTVNMRAPILIGLSSRLMLQAILPDEFLSLRRPLWNQAQRDEMKSKIQQSSLNGE
jgi:flagellar assembly factor FliW